MTNSGQDSSAQGGFYVTIVTSGGTTTKRVEGDLLTVGRAEDSNLVISHETLSRRHLSVSLRGGECFIEDHGSSNGTCINGKRIKPHLAVRVKPDDEITMGESPVRLNVSVEPVMRKEGAPPVAGVSEGTGHSIVTSTGFGRRATAIAQAPAAKPPTAVDDANLQGERILQEAQKKAATTVQQAELEAEKRVEEIYRRAHETQAKMDEVYQKRMNEAYRSAEQIFQKSQEEAQRVLADARTRSTEIRDQAETFVRELRTRTEEDCERMLDDAQRTARDLKEQRLLEAEEQITKKTEDVIAQTRAEVNERVARLEQELARDAAKQRDALAAELEERRADWEQEHTQRTDEAQKLTRKLETLRADTAAAEEASARLRKEVETQTSTLASLTQHNESATKTKTELKSAVEQLSSERADTEAKAKAAQTQLARLTDEVTRAGERIVTARAEAERALGEIKAHLDAERVRIEREEAAALSEAKLQTTQRTREFELQMANELDEKKEHLAREATLIVQSFLKSKNLHDINTSQLDQDVRSLVERQIETIAEDDSAKKIQASLVALRRRQKWMSMFTGAALGGVIVFGGQFVNRQLNGELSPMQRRVAAAQEERRQDLAERRFNPPLTPKYKETYFDNVINTEKFVDTYLSDEFQKRLLEGSSKYMLRMWRLDENKMIEALGITTALVKQLGEKRALIHPDTIQKNLDVMKQLDQDAHARLRELMGSHVRLESFKKFERQFYDDYRPAGG